MSTTRLERLYPHVRLAWCCATPIAYFATLFFFFAGHTMIAWTIGIVPMVTGLAAATTIITDHEKQRRLHKLTACLPKIIHVLEQTDERTLAHVERQDGKQMMIELPPGYHPSQDGFKPLLEQTSPELDDRLMDAFEQADMEMELRQMLDEEEQ